MSVRYGPFVAYDPTRAALLAGGVGQVFAVGDTSFTTPLTTTDLAGIPLPNLRANPDGVVAAFDVVEDELECVWKSGDYLVHLSSFDALRLMAEATAEALAIMESEMVRTVNGVDPDETGNVTIPTGGGGNDLGWKNVQNHPLFPAVGNGVADDRAAINASITAAGTYGTVYFPRSAVAYGLSGDLKPLEGQTWWYEGMGRYAWDSAYSGGGGFRALPGFSGPALIYNDPSTSNGISTGVSRGVTLINPRLFGRGEDGAVNGIDFGPASGSERAWKIRGGQIMYCKTGLAGHMWVVDVEGLHISRCEVGVAAHRGVDTAARINDSIFMKNFIYFTKSHGFWMGGSAESGQVNLVANRFERSGTSMDPMDPNVNRDEAAHGLFITRATAVTLTGNSSDANSGSGLKIAAASAGAVNNVTGSGNVWKRDGTGNNVDSMVAGVSISGSKNCTFFGDTITYGDPNDSGPGRAAPQYGLEYEANDFLVWKGSIELQTGTLANGIREIGSANYRCQVSAGRVSYDVLPQFTTATRPPAPPRGAIGFNDASGVKAPEFWDGTGWVTLGGDAGSWKGTQAEYDALPTKGDGTMYAVLGGSGVRRLYMGHDLMSEWTAPFVGKKNSFAGITSGAGVTAANSGGASGDAFNADAVGSVVANTSADLTAAYDRGIVCTLAASSSAYVPWTHADYSAAGWIRCYVRRSATPGVTTRPVRGYNAGSLLWEIRWQADGQVIMANAAGDWLASVAGADQLDTIYRIEANPTAKQLRVFTGESVSAMTPTPQPGTPTAGAWDSTRFGIFTTAAASLSHQLAGVAIGTSGWIGPA